MANAHNKKPAKSFQDDLDAIFDGIHLKNNPENLADDNDDFDHLSMDSNFVETDVKDVKNEDNKDEMLDNASADKPLMTAEQERPGPKLVKIDTKLEKKHDIDALLDNFDDKAARINRPIPVSRVSDFDFQTLTSEDEPHSSHDDVPSFSVSEQKAFKPGEFDELEDFEALDEFGEINFEAPDPVAGTENITLLPVVDNIQTLESTDDESTRIAERELSKVGAGEPSDSMYDEKLALEYELLEDYDSLKLQEEAVYSKEDSPERLKEGALGKPEMVANELEKNDFPPLSHFAQDNEVDDYTVDQVEDNDVRYTQAEDDKHHLDDLFDKSEFIETEEFAEDWPPLAVAIQQQGRDHGQIGAIETLVDKVSDFNTVPPKVTVTADPGVMAQIGKLWDAHNLIQQDVDALKQNVEAQESDKMEQLDRQSKERRERKQLQELVETKTKQTPKLVYAALGTSVLSLLMAGGLFVLGSSAISDIKALKEHLLTIDKDLATLKIEAKGGAAFTPSKLESEGAKAELLTAPDAPALPEPVSQDAEKNVDAKSIRVIAAVDKNATPPDSRSEKTISKAPTSWVANLVSVRQDWYAKQKVSEFAKQGVQAVIVPINIKGETLYILRSGSFATQEQALQYASKAKKALSLPSVLVTRDE